MKAVKTTVIHTVDLDTYEIALILDSLVDAWKALKEDAERYREIEERRDDISTLFAGLGKLVNRNFIDEALN